jgi:hypothetical protein
MSWLYSRALVAEYLAVTCSDGAQSALLSGSPTPQAFLPSDKMTTFSHPSRFGMTFAPLTDTLGAELLTWCQAVSRARTYPLQEKAQALLEPEAECGVTWRGSLAKFDPVSCSWKTVQLCLLGDSELSSVTWPRSGMTAAGQCWELPILGRRIKGTDSGLWQTPVEDDLVNRKGASATSGDGLATAVAMRWPTPIASDSRGSSGKPAPGKQVQLVDMVKVATPTARDWRSGKASQATHDKNSRPLSEQIGGSLNPTWVEWLMGWPLGWTDLKPLETDKCPSALPPLGGC